MNNKLESIFMALLRVEHNDVRNLGRSLGDYKNLRISYIIIIILFHDDF